MNKHPIVPLGRVALIAVVGSAGLHAQTVTPPAEPEVIRLDPFSVQADRIYGYRATNSMTATGFSTPIYETPLNISVITEEFLKDLGAVDFTNAVGYLPAVNATPDYGNNGLSFRSRGFDTSWVVRNGLRRYSTIGMENVLRLEAVRGPVSVFYGQSNPGGVINYVTKRPSFEREVEVSTSYGSYNRAYGRVAAQGPVVKDKLAYRVYASALDSDGPMDFYRDRQDYVYGGVLFQPVQSVQIIAEGEFLRSRANKDQRLPWGVNPQYYADYANPTAQQIAWAVSQGQTQANAAGWLRGRWRRSNTNWANDTFSATGVLPARMPEAVDPDVTSSGWDWNLGGAGKTEDRDLGIFTVDANWKLNDMFTFRTSAQYDDSDVVFLNANDDQLDGDLRFTPGASASRRVNESWTYRAELLTHVETGPIGHKLLTGAEFFREDYTAYNGGIRSTAGSAFDSNVGYDPRTGQNADIRDFFTGVWNYGFGQENTRDALYGTYVGTALDKRLNVMVGARSETFRSESVGATVIPPKETELTPMGGVVFEVVKGVSLYSSYSESFFPNYGGLVSGPGATADERNTFAPPQVGKGMEAGVKVSTPDNRITGTLTAFRTSFENDQRTRDDAATDNDPRNNDANPSNDVVISRLAGKRQATGLEADVMYMPSRNYMITAAVSYIPDREIKENVADPRLIGSKLVGVPLWQASLWNRYTFTDDTFKGLSLGAGVRYSGSSYVNPNQFWIPAQSGSYWVIDAMASYDTELFGQKALWALNIGNVLDKKYLYSGNGKPGDPFRVNLSLTMKF